MKGPSYLENQLKKSPAGIAVGYNKGHLVNKIKNVKSSSSMFRLTDRVKVIRSVIRDTVGFAPYERRIMEIIKGGGNNPQKRALKFAKNRLGAHQRAKRKVKDMEDAIARSNLKKK
jgi:large subunit ribosomal protein L36e